MEDLISKDDLQLRKAIKFVAIANLLYFFIEFYFALKGDSVSLFADSIDFLEDASVNFLIVVALSWSIQKRARLGFVLAMLLLLPGVAALFTAVHKIYAPIIPDPEILSFVGGGAFIVNGICALRLMKYKNHQGSLVKAAFWSARNDLYANIAIMVSGVVTAYMGSYWPDILVGIGIGVLNIGAANDVLRAAKKERAQARP
jgi:Co/Zn/Cd efflux system component